ncbi:hypothetical protein [Paenibacillus ihuae]|uniref:hypothetical protein n=1 Tax=Paenibacillus ihuae TaxID=1232431 RepID=UPI00131CCCC4|nr:hypothetical protein [Paenibacillus ihuae]
MKWMSTLLGQVNNRRTIMSLVALAVGVIGFGAVRRRRLRGNAWRQMIQPVRRVF